MDPINPNNLREILDTLKSCSLDELEATALKVYETLKNLSEVVELHRDQIEISEKIREINTENSNLRKEFDTAPKKLKKLAEKRVKTDKELKKKQVEVEILEKRVNQLSEPTLGNICKAVCMRTITDAFKLLNMIPPWLLKSFQNEEGHVYE